MGGESLNRIRRVRSRRNAVAPATHALSEIAARNKVVKGALDRPTGDVKRRAKLRCAIWAEREEVNKLGEPGGFRTQGYVRTYTWPNRFRQGV